MDSIRRDTRESFSARSRNSNPFPSSIFTLQLHWILLPARGSMDL